MSSAWKNFTDKGRRLFGSTAFWLVALLLLAEAVAHGVEPRGAEEQYAGKLGTYFSIPARSNVILLGSSVATASTYNVDVEIDPLLKREQPEKTSYLEARYLERQLSGALGWPARVANLSIAGCMASDAWLILSRLLDFGRQPGLVVYQTCARDFMDATMPPPGETPSARTLASIRPPAQSNWVSGGPRSWLERAAALPLVSQCLMVAEMGGEALSDRAGERMVNAVASSASSLYRRRGASSKWLAGIGASLYNRESTLLGAALATGFSKQGAVPDAAACSETEAGVYLADPAPYETRFDRELPYFIRLLKLCRDRGVPLVVVNMPVTEACRLSLPPQVVVRYRNEACAAPRRYGAAFIDLDGEGGFDDAKDFTDHIHTSASGGKKVTDRLCAALFRLRSNRQLSGR